MSVRLPNPTIRIHEGLLLISFPYCAEGNAAVKACGFRWQPGERAWGRAVEPAGALSALLRREGLDQVATWLHEQTGAASSETTSDLRADPPPASFVAAASAGAAHRPRRADLFDVGADEASESEATDAAEAAEAAWSVSRLIAEVNGLVQRRFSRSIMVQGTASNLVRAVQMERAYGAFFQLVELNEATGRTQSVTVHARLAAWRRALEVLREAGVEPVDDLPLRLRGRVQLGSVRGELQVVLESVDPVFSLGVFAQRREEVLLALRRDALIGRNTALPMPRVPLRVALVTASGSDAARDVLSKLQASPWAFEVRVFDVRVQGPQLRRTVLEALRAVAADAASWDVCVVARGGGSRSELADWDDVEVARAVARLPVKVVVGIGHERDVSAIDAVAFSRRTPTDAAVSLIERVEEAWTLLEEARARVARQARTRVSDEHVRVMQAARLVRIGSRGASAASERGLHEAASRLARAARGRVRDEEARQRVSGWLRMEGAARRRLLREVERLGRATGFLRRRVPLEQRRREASLQTRVDRLRRATGRTELGRAERNEPALLRRLRASAAAALAREERRLAGDERLMKVVDPLRPLRMGYALVQTASGSRVRPGEPLAPGDELVLRLLDRLVGVRVDTVAPNPRYEEHPRPEVHVVDPGKEEER